MNTPHRHMGLLLTLIFALMMGTSVMAQETQSINPGQLVSGEIGLGERDNYTLEAQQGDVLNVTLSSEEFDAYLYILNEDGDRLTFNDDGPDMGLNAMIRGFTIPETGTYTIQAASFADEGEGQYVLQAEILALTMLALGEPATVNFNTDVQSFTFALEGSIGQILDITVESGNQLNTRLELLNPSSFPAYENDDAEPGTVDPALRAVTLDSNGTYLVVLSAVDDREVLLGEVTITATASDLASLDNGTVTMQFDLDINQQITRFQGNGGEIVQLYIVMNDGLDTALPTFLLIQDNITFANFTMNSLNEALVRVVIPADGEVTILAEAFTDASLTITLERNE